MSACKTAYIMAIAQQTRDVLHIKDKLCKRATELVNTQNPTQWDKTKIY